ncbi:MAG: SIMPL domain-containing protein [Bacteroidetes bacterium]|nr:SIMPL domain-containing protein [Bacteroidota bacterium]
MSTDNKQGALILGAAIVLGLSFLGFILGTSALKIKNLERTVSVKGLSEREFPADIVIWPIQFTDAGNSLEGLYDTVDKSTGKIVAFLESKGIDKADISSAIPSITDKSAQQYGGQDNAAFRYTAIQTVTVYSKNVDAVRKVMGEISDLGKEGIVITGGGYEALTEYLFTRLNEIKPEMIEEATRNARETAEKFATDSQSSLGKIKQANQGQFSIEARDANNPHIKTIRVVSTVEYYLSD